MPYYLTLRAYVGGPADRIARPEAPPVDLERLAKVSGAEPEALHVFTLWMANDRPSVDGRLAFKRESMGMVARAMDSQPILRNHQNSRSEDLPVGRVFQTWAAEGDGVAWAGARAFMAKEPLGDSLKARIDAGVITECSMGIYVEAYCSICGETFDSNCRHVPGQKYGEQVCRQAMEPAGDDAGEELSLVWKGRLSNTAVFSANHREAPDLVAEIEKRAEVRSWWKPASPGWWVART